MKSYLRQLKKVIGPQSSGLPGIFVRFVVLSLLEAIGISLVVPVMSSLGVGGGTGTAQPGGVPSADGWLLTPFGLTGTAGLLLLVLVVFYAKAIFGYRMQRAILRFGYANQKRLIDTMVVNYEQMPVTAAVKAETADMVQNLIVNVEIVSIGTVVTFIRMLAESFVIIAIVGVLVVLQPVVSLIAVAIIAGILAGYDLFVRARLHATGKVAARHRTHVIKGFQDVMNGLREIRVIGKLDFFNRQIFESTAAVMEATVDYKSLFTIPPYLVESVALTGFATVFVVGRSLGLADGEILSAVAMFAVAAARLIPGTNHVVGSVVQMRNARYALERVYETLVTLEAAGRDHDPRRAETPQRNLIQPPSRIVCRDVTFSYVERSESVLRGASFTIEHGSLVCLKGESGSGKSTTLDLLLGFLEPGQGAVLADDVDIRDLGDEWRSLFVFVPQDPFVFSGTIRENITLETPADTNTHRLRDAIDLACLTEVIEAIPGGVDARLEEGGDNLSGGQRQRIALARAFYLDRPIYLLDEPTSALDPATADQLLDNLASMRGHKTIVMVSHDVKVQSRCDQILAFGGGLISSTMTTAVRFAGATSRL